MKKKLIFIFVISIFLALQSNFINKVRAACDFCYLSGYGQTIKKDATCTESGYTKRICGECGATISQSTISKKGHNWRNATCTNPKTCTRCGATSGGVAAHSFSSARSLNNVAHTRVCSSCNYVLAEVHTPNLNSPNCTTDKVCTGCGYVYLKSIGHKYVYLKKSDTLHTVTCTKCFYFAEKEHNFVNDVCTLCYYSKYCKHTYKVVNYEMYHVEVCTKCGEEGETNYHQPNIPAATCTQDMKCTGCDFVYEKRTGERL